ncbi:unnamed protein product [Rotaria sordida]|uniref:Potassium channel tetramerisation-type BTB domain-containing protein n=1 Tax=Rotaria sordida TaxID=392033 RepID=A0A814VWM3_9BILA|nr:unnamed protein product [Rotaria sordida]
MVSLIKTLQFAVVLHIVRGALFNKSQTMSSSLSMMKQTGNFHTSHNNEVFLLNVGGELMYATRDTLTYIPNTVLSSVILSTTENRSKLIQHDENGRLFIDLPPILFKHALEQLRRWKNRGNISADREILPPSWHVKNEFDEMLISLGLAKYRQNLPIECTLYNVSDDPSRHVGTGGGTLCDRDLVGWTRFIDRAGNVIVRQAPGIGCGGQKSGWLLGTYPTEPWTTTLSTLCYTDEMRIPCRAWTPIRTTHCGSFLVFELRSPPFCPARVCTDDYNLN